MNNNKEKNDFNDLSNDDYNLPSGDIETSKFSETNNDIDKDKVNIYEFKVIMLGNVAVGKTAIINRFVDNTFLENYKCTLQTAFRSNSINIDRKSNVNMKIWDTCGEEKYKSLTRQYYRDTHGIILICDLTNVDSFNSLPTWLSDIKKYGPKEYDIILIGNKSDLELQRAISSEEIQIFAERENLTYLEVSAKNGINVLLLFERIAEKMIKTNKESNQSNNDIKRNSNLLSYNDGEFKSNSKAEQQLRKMVERENGRKKNCC